MRRWPMHLAGVLISCGMALWITGVWWIGLPIAATLIVGEEWRARNPEAAKRLQNG